MEIRLMGRNVIFRERTNAMRFIVDGQWTADPYASQEVVNAFGSTNSVAEVR